MKKLYALAAALFLSAAPASAAPSDCWYGTSRDKTLTQFDCDVVTRRNANNHIVHDVSTGNDTFTAVLWGTESQRRGEADFIHNGTSDRVRYWVDDDGDIRLYSDKSVVVFRFPNARRRIPAPSGTPRPGTYSDAIREALFR